MSCLNSQDWMVEGVIRLPSLVSAKLAIAQAHDWGALVDAYLVDAAEVGDRFVAYVYGDLSGQLGCGVRVCPISLWVTHSGVHQTVRS